MSFQAVVEEFQELHGEYRTVAGAEDKCTEASAAFIDLLIERGFLDPRRPRSEWEVQEIDVVDGTSHYAARIGVVIFDWTARQFDPMAEFPKVSICPECW